MRNRDSCISGGVIRNWTYGGGGHVGTVCLRMQKDGSIHHKPVLSGLAERWQFQPAFYKEDCVEVEML